MQRKMSAWALSRLVVIWAALGHSCFSAEISLTGAIGDLNPHNLFVNGLDPEVPMQALMASRQSDVWTLEITNNGSETWTEFQIRILGIPDAAASSVQFDSEDLPEVTNGYGVVSNTAFLVADSKKHAWLEPPIARLPPQRALELRVPVINTSESNANYFLNIRAIAAVPEPTTFAMLIGGLTLLVLARSRWRYRCWFGVCGSCVTTKLT